MYPAVSPIYPVHYRLMGKKVNRVHTCAYLNWDKVFRLQGETVGPLGETNM